MLNGPHWLHCERFRKLCCLFIYLFALVLVFCYSVGMVSGVMNNGLYAQGHSNYSCSTVYGNCKHIIYKIKNLKKCYMTGQSKTDI